MVRYSEKFISHADSTLHYFVAGSGPEALVAFHGFGQDHHAFDHWVKTLSGRYTFYFFDLYFHGSSTWNDSSRSLTARLWAEIFALFLQQQTIERLTVAGFSLGGKFALATLLAFPERISRLVLIAPDGITTNFWYTLATYPWLLRKLFNGMIRNEKLFRQLTTTAVRLGLIDKWLSRFAESQMDTEEKRRRAYNSWVTYRHLTVAIDTVVARIRSFDIPLTIFTGRYDRVIPTRSVASLSKHFPASSVAELNVGHNQLIHEAAEVLAQNEFSKNV